jgi:predicted transcriptional regulator
MRTLKVGISNRDAFKKRTMAIVKGEYKPSKNEPRVWFE